MPHLGRAIDLFRIIDTNSDGVVSKIEFHLALSKLQLESVPTRAVSDALFDECDLDGSGAIEYKELHQLLRRRVPPPARAVPLAPRLADSAPSVIRIGRPNSHALPLQPAGNLKLEDVGALPAIRQAHSYGDNGLHKPARGSMGRPGGLLGGHYAPLRETSGQAPLMSRPPQHMSSPLHTSAAYSVRRSVHPPKMTWEGGPKRQAGMYPGPKMAYSNQMKLAPLTSAMPTVDLVRAM